MVALAVFLLIARWVTQLWLSALNERHGRAQGGQVPAVFRDTIDVATFRRSVEYTAARLRLGRWEDTLGLLVMLVVLFSGLLPWIYTKYVAWRGNSAWALAGFLLGAGVLLSALGWPLAWYEQFRLEERFGFNTTTRRTWWLDRLKGLCLAAIVGYPLLVLILKVVRWTGPWWWAWAWGCVVAFQCLMLVLAPVLILPLFNKFSPLPEGSLKERLLELARRARFRARSIQIMDGSKRSRHSNAFFTGFGRFRRIVLFDTLVQQLTEPELEAVLAHEIGHYRLGHVPKLLASSILGLLGGLLALAWLAQQDWFYRAFGFLPGDFEPALLLFGLLSGAVTFWVSPLVHFWSRRFEYQADRFAATLLEDARPLISALRKLNEKNLSNLTPHPFYSGFYYSHPTLLEREQALAPFPAQPPP